MYPYSRSCDIKISNSNQTNGPCLTECKIARKWLPRILAVDRVYNLLRKVEGNRKTLLYFVSHYITKAKNVATFYFLGTSGSLLNV